MISFHFISFQSFPLTEASRSGNPQRRSEIPCLRRKGGRLQAASLQRRRVPWNHNPHLRRSPATTAAAAPPYTHNLSPSLLPPPRGLPAPPHPHRCHCCVHPPPPSPSLLLSLSQSPLGDSRGAGCAMCPQSLSPVEKMLQYTCRSENTPPPQSKAARSTKTKSTLAFHSSVRVICLVGQASTHHRNPVTQLDTLQIGGPYQGLVLSFVIT